MTNQKRLKVWRQGDIPITEILELPDDAVEIAHDGILAYGEATGHKHQIVPGPNSRVRFFRSEKINVFEVITGFADLHHEGHFTHRFPKGLYRWDRQREADWMNEATRNVED